MIEFVFGREPSSKTEYIIEKMKEQLSKGKRCVLIIPEQEALFWDTVTATRFKATDAFNIEAVSFKRLANSVFRAFGGIAKKYVTDAEKSLLMWSAVQSVSDRLKTFTRPDRDDRYVPLLLRTTGEMKLYGISPEALSEAGERLFEKSPALCDRLYDLALIYAAYESLLHSRAEDPDEIPDALADCLKSNVYFENTAVFVDSFYTLTPKEMAVVREIIPQADSFLVTFSMVPEDAKDPTCHHIASYMKEMARNAARVGKDIKKTVIEDCREKEFALIGKGLWNYETVPYADNTDRITFVKCTDRYDEAVLAGARIKDLVSRGASFGDISVVCADIEAVRGITDIELLRQGIPVYVSGKTPVTSQPAIRLLLSTASVLAGGWKKEDIIAVARTGLTDLTPDETDALELYTHIWKIRGKKKFCPENGWDMNPCGYTAEESAWGQRLLSLANSAREKLIPQIEAFSESFPGTVRDACSAAYKLLCDFNVYESLCRETAELEKAGKLSEAQKKSQVWQAVCSTLDTLASTVPDAIVDGRRFAALLRRVSDTFMIGTIPDGIDRVSLTGAQSNKKGSTRHLIVLGAKSGEFPKIAREDSFFSDRDREALRLAGIEISPETEKKQREELFRFAEICSSPKESLTVFIPSEPSGNHPSLGALRLTELFPKAKTYDFTSVSGERIIRAMGSSAGDLTGGELSADYDRAEGAALTKLFDKDIKLTQTRIESFNSCAFKYYCEYILRLNDLSPAEVRHSVVGTFVHSVLENFMKEAAKNNEFPMSDDVLISKTDRLMAELKADILPKDPDGYAQYMFARLEKSISLFAKALNDEFSQSKFTPYGFELKVGFSDDLPAIPIRLENGHDLTVRGIVDRMDIYKDGDSIYVRVVDYKTGSKTFSLQKAMKGENIQLLLYLFALCNMPKGCSFAKELAPNGEKIRPAGAVYFSAKPGDISSNELVSTSDAEEFALGAISRTGIVLGDESIIEAMDSQKSGRYSPARIDGKGKLKGSFLETEEDFQKLKKAIDSFLLETGNEMISGRACSDPKGRGQSSPCRYCAMMPLCRHSESPKNEKGGDFNE